MDFAVSRNLHVNAVFAIAGIVVWKLKYVGILRNNKNEINNMIV